MSRSNLLSLLAAALLAPVAAAQTELPPAPETAGPLPPAPSVEELVVRALERSPALQALAARLAAAQEMESPASSLPDPMIEAMVQEASFPDDSIGEEDMSMAGVEVRQDLLYPGKRRAAGEVARAHTSVRAAELAELERRVAAEVRQLYARLYALDRERQALGAARELVEMLAATAAARYAAGEAEQGALIKAQLQVSRLDEQLDDLAAERAAMVAELNRWLDLPGESPLGEVAALPELSAPAPPWAATAVAAAPELVVARRAVNAAEKRLAVSELELKPNLSALAGLAQRGSLDPVATLRFGVELPLWRRRKQEPMVRAARQELEMASRELADREAMARSEAARIAAAWTQAERQILRFREAILPQTSAALDAARSSYLAGRGDFSTVVEDFNLWLEARVELARREADRFTAWAELARLTGLSGSPAGGQS
jgi:outer membrane protein TolC